MNPISISLDPTLSNPHARFINSHLDGSYFQRHRVDCGDCVGMAVCGVDRLGGVAGFVLGHVTGVDQRHVRLYVAFV